MANRFPYPQFSQNSHSNREVNTYIPPEKHRWHELDASLDNVLNLIPIYEVHSYQEVVSEVNLPPEKSQASEVLSDIGQRAFDFSTPPEPERTISNDKTSLDPLEAARLLVAESFDIQEAA